MAQAEMERLKHWRDKVHRRLVEVLNDRHNHRHAHPSIERREANLYVRNILDAWSKEIPTDLDQGQLAKEVLDQTLGLGPLEDLLRDEHISEIMINGPKQIYIERQGRIEHFPHCFNNGQEVMNIIEKIVSPLGRRIDEASPLVDARLSDGSRVNAIIPPLALNGPCLTIRKFKAIPFTPDTFLEMGSITPAILEFLKICVAGRCNVLISGGTGAGKTTLLNLLSSFIPRHERIITIEDAAELKLPQDHVVSLESRPANIEGMGEIPIRRLVRNALRMRPDRIVVGECRGGEALDMLQAMNTGHDGSLTTGHANDTREMLLRLETMVLMSGVELPVKAIREQICSAIDLIIQIERLASGTRKITRVTEVCGMEGDVITTQDIFAMRPEVQFQILPTGIMPAFGEKLARHNLHFPPELFSCNGWTP